MGAGQAESNIDATFEQNVFNLAQRLPLHHGAGHRDRGTLA